MAFPYYQTYQPQYPQYFPNNYQPMQQQTYNPVANQSGNNQPVNGGLVTVRSEAEARAYPVAPGTSVTFKNENAPYCYTKTMGFSQLEAPKFERFRLVREDAEEATTDDVNSAKSEYAPKSDINILAAAIQSMQKDYESLKAELESARADIDYVMTKRSASKPKKEIDTDN